jgi:hypothetical protein
MFYWTKTLVTCGVAGLVGAYAGTYLTFKRSEQAKKELAELIIAQKPDKSYILDINEDWIPDVVMQKNGKYSTFLGQKDGSFKQISDSTIEQKIREITKK